jgi:imidazolonepropionase-like amidohydrolase
MHVSLIAACATFADHSSKPLKAKANPDKSATPAIAFIGASLFTGQGFEKRTLCVADKKIVDCRPEPTEVIDLGGAFITPPFGDAHTHHFDGLYTLDWHISLGLQSGTFYAMTMTAPVSGVQQIRSRLSGSGNIDVATSLGGITGPQSHPTEIYEALALIHRSYQQQLANAAEIRKSSLVADNAYYIVETEDDVREKLAALLEQQPDHIKVYLRHSERYADDWGKWGPGGGINPDLLPLIAEIADASNLRLAVATSSVADYRKSLAVGADIITHLQCYQDTESDPKSPYYDISEEDECLLTSFDAQSASKLKMASTVVVTEWAKDRPEKLVLWEKKNIATLQAANAPIVVAVEAYGSSITEGLIAGVEKGFFLATDMLRIASMDTPAFIFPDRRIGCLEIGCEASFLAFKGNPLEDFNAIRTFAYQMKDGDVIVPTN